MQIQEWLCLNCQTQRAVSGQLGDTGKMPPTSSGPKASPKPVPADQPPQKTAVATQEKVKKKEEVKTEVIPEKVKETPFIEKAPPKVITDPKQEESKQEKDKNLAPQEKKPPPEDKKTFPEEKKSTTEEIKPTLVEKKAPPEEKKPIPEDKKTTPEDKQLPSGAKPLVLEEVQKHDLLKTQVGIAEEKPDSGVTPQAVPEKTQTQTKMKDLPSRTSQSLPEEDGGTTHKIKEPQQEACTAKPDQVEPGKEKTVSYIFLTLHSLMYVIY